MASGPSSTLAADHRRLGGPDVRTLRQARPGAQDTAARRHFELLLRTRASRSSVGSARLEASTFSCGASGGVSLSSSGRPAFEQARQWYERALRRGPDLAPPIPDALHRRRVPSASTVTPCRCSGLGFAPRPRPACDVWPYSIQPLALMTGLEAVEGATTPRHPRATLDHQACRPRPGRSPLARSLSTFETSPTNSCSKRKASKPPAKTLSSDFALSSSRDPLL